MPIELLAPAGSPEALDAAIGEGADAVYLGLKNFNARMRSTNFTYSRFEAALRSLRRMGKKIYVTVNTVFEQREADRMYQLLKYLSILGPDALIVQDFGVLAMVRSEFPGLKLHASTQMNIASGRGINALSRHGVSRVVLARELSIEELRSIRAQTNMELEVFVHGALCVCASGLCLFSSYLGGKSANRGMCTQACRRLYTANDSANGGVKDSAIGGALGGAMGGALSEEGYYFSPSDLQLLEELPQIAAAGINAIKIEGRMKSADYVGAVVSAYRLVLDAVNTNSDDDTIRQSIIKGQEILRGDYARSKTKFLFTMAVSRKDLDWINPQQDGGTGINLGIIQKTRSSTDDKQGLVSAGNCPVQLAPGDSIRLHRYDDSVRVSHKLKCAEAAGQGNYWISIPGGFGKGDQVYLIQTKALSKRYRPVITEKSTVSKREPGHEKAPLPQPAAGKKIINFPEGLYVAVSRIEDLYIVQSSRPEGIILTLNRKNARYLLSEGKKPLPFKPADIILTLDPYFPQTDDETLTEDISFLTDRGYRQFMVNNIGHFSLFRDIRSSVRIIAGPWLYMFNSWSLSFIASMEVEGFVSPYENNRQNLERTLGPPGRQSQRSRFFIPVFAWPTLFRIRANLGQAYDFTSLRDNRGEHFNLICDPDRSLVISNKPFAITDKIPFLKESGFHRFIIDLSGPPLKKNNYKDLMQAVNKGIPLPRISRFNWKDGFFTSEQGAGSREQGTGNRGQGTEKEA